ncbi:REP-associated tyrosine transposase [Bremerella sp. P1]|uniref:REP-associated tyrosine transposase n=1 Tax=Bremerella sp. P1 TaxID=3026424 RepID=UPI00236831B3|nr:transposase [Bremerella sp. P1]WDI40876.1 transposase [Bremerella sp. P1]
MANRRQPLEQLYIHFVTFSCYHRRRILEYDQANRVVLGCLNTNLKVHRGRCAGFVLMPDHVHALVWFDTLNQLPSFIQKWKHDSSYAIKEQYRRWAWSYGDAIGDDTPIWQRRYYSFEIYHPAKIQEKLDYMHMNPVRAKFALLPAQWRWSSARWYDKGKSVGVPISMPEF